MRRLNLTVGMLLLLQLTAAHAYIGPGLAAGTVAIVLGVLASIFLAFVGILWYPIKRLINRRRGLPPNQKAKDSLPGSR